MINKQLSTTIESNVLPRTEVKGRENYSLAMWTGRTQANHEANQNRFAANPVKPHQPAPHLQQLQIRMNRHNISAWVVIEPVRVHGATTSMFAESTRQGSFQTHVAMTIRFRKLSSSVFRECSGHSCLRFSQRNCTLCQGRSATRDNPTTPINQHCATMWLFRC